MQAVDRVTSILDFLSKRTEGMPISAIASHVNLSLGTTYRFLQALIDHGYVQQDPVTKFYKTGLRILSLASKLLNSNQVNETGKIAMQQTAEILNNVVYLCQENRGEVICTCCVNPSNGQNVKFVAQIGASMPFNAAAAAKIIFCFESDLVVQGLYAKYSPLTPFTAKTKITLDAILNDFKDCRLKGYAICDEELEPGVLAVSAPIRNYDDKVIASVSVTAVKNTVSLEDLVNQITECANKISTSLGYTN